jgi:hypothetical protein
MNLPVVPRGARPGKDARAHVVETLRLAGAGPPLLSGLSDGIQSPKQQETPMPALIRTHFAKTRQPA